MNDIDVKRVPVDHTTPEAKRQRKLDENRNPLLVYHKRLANGAAAIRERLAGCTTVEERSRMLGNEARERERLIRIGVIRPVKKEGGK